MGGEWPTVSISTIGQLFDGPHATPPTQETGPVFLGIDALDNGRLNLTSVKHVSQATYQKWTRRIRPQPGDLVFSYETRIGQAALIPEEFECCLGRRLALIRVDRNRITPGWLLYYYLAPIFQDILRAHTKPGSTVDRIHLTDVPGLPITLPPIRYQEAVAELLGALDEKIELSRRMAGISERLAQALFKSWFIDFDPVLARTGGRSTGLSDDLIALFPDSLGTGGVPEGWAGRPISSLGQFLNGLALQKYPAIAGEASLPVIKIADLRTGPTTKSDRASVSIPADYIV